MISPKSGWVNRCPRYPLSKSLPGSLSQVDCNDLKQSIRHYSSKSLAQRKTWYSPAATAYDAVRPRYPQALIREVVAIAHLTHTSTLLEIGCGPATATLAFAPLDCPMHCLEPNPDFYELACRNCQPYPNVTIQNTSFEEWSLEPSQFDAVIAATSFHWISPEIAYPKAAQALRENGHLILLWNKELQPTEEVWQRLSGIYHEHAPALAKPYETEDIQSNILQGLGQLVLESGQFKDLIAGQAKSEVVYTTDQYLTLLNTYSPYLELEPSTKTALFAELRNTIDADFDGQLQLSYTSAFHIAQRR